LLIEICDLTNSSMYRTKKADKWILFIECMLKGLSLRKTAEVVGITHVTAFIGDIKRYQLFQKRVSVYSNLSSKQY
jgi:transposase-like protein